MPNNILVNLPPILSEAGKATLDYVDLWVQGEPGRSVEPGTIHQICKANVLDLIWARKIARMQVCISGAMNGQSESEKGLGLILKPSRDVGGCISQVS